MLLVSEKARQGDPAQEQFSISELSQEFDVTTRAIRFYEKHGFKWVATHPDGVWIGAQSRDDYFYCLRLGS